MGFGGCTRVQREKAEQGYPRAVGAMGRSQRSHSARAPGWQGPEQAPGAEEKVEGALCRRGGSAPTSASGTQASCHQRECRSRCPVSDSGDMPPAEWTSVRALRVPGMCAGHTYL